MRSLLCLEQLADRVVPAILNTNPFQFGLFRNGTWFLDINNNHLIDGGDTTFIYGAPGDVPITGDWNASGHTAVGVFRNFNGAGLFVLDFNNNHRYDAGDHVFFYGVGTDRPIVGDWDGAGRDKIGIYRNVNGAGLFVLDTNGHEHYDASATVFFFGAGTNTPVTGDWNGSGNSKVGVFGNVGNGIFILDYNGNHTFDSGDLKFFYGVGTDIPIIGDWNGDAHDKVGVVRDNGHGALLWVLDYNGDLTYDAGDRFFTYGLNTDRPVVGQW